ncbi:MAG: ceramide glucosyltransferase [Hyphomicrobiaceae bacterium]
MELLAHVAGAFAVAALLIHVATSLSTAWRCRRSAEPRPSREPERGAAVTIIRPVCGLDAYEEATLRSTFELDYPQLEILLCCGSAQDPVVPLVQRLIAEHPHVEARLLIGDDRVSENPKLNNVIKGWRAASHAWIVITDSNVLLPRDYIDRLFAAWTPGTGLVSAPPIGTRPANLWAELECAFLNGYQARWQFTADSLGYGFAQGKTLFWRRIDLERAGGIHALGAELAEDAASTKIVREQGLRVRLVDGAFPQPLGFRALPSVWSRQLRWARLRRATFPVVYSLEIFSGLFAPLACCVLAAWWLELPEVLTALLFVAIWLGSEYGLNATAGWPLSWRSPIMWLLRDVLLPVLWLQSWLGNGLSWRGNDMSVAGPGSSTLSDWLRRA